MFDAATDLDGIGGFGITARCGQFLDQSGTNVFSRVVRSGATARRRARKRGMRNASSRACSVTAGDWPHRHLRGRNLLEIEERVARDRIVRNGRCLAGGQARCEDQEEPGVRLHRARAFKQRAPAPVALAEEPPTSPIDWPCASVAKARSSSRSDDPTRKIQRFSGASARLAGLRDLARALPSAAPSAASRAGSSRG